MYIYFVLESCVGVLESIFCLESFSFVFVGVFDFFCSLLVGENGKHHVFIYLFQFVGGLKVAGPMEKCGFC